MKERAVYDRSRIQIWTQCVCFHRQARMSIQERCGESRRGESSHLKPPWVVTLRYRLKASRGAQVKTATITL